MIEITNIPRTDSSISIAESFSDIIRESVTKSIRVFPRNSLWASQIDHPCIRSQEYGLLRWQDQIPPSPDLQEIFDEGKMHEPAVIDKLQKSGFEVKMSQYPLNERVRKNGTFYKYNISGRLDIMIRHQKWGDRWYPAEIKTCEPRAFESINSLEDMLHHKRYYIRMYPSQLMLYLYLIAKGESGMFILKNKVNGKLKCIPVVIDYGIVEGILKKAERINQVVEKAEADLDNLDKHLDDRIEYDDKICNGCPFRIICSPDTRGSGEMIMDEDLINLLDRRSELKTFADEYEEIDEEAKTAIKNKLAIGKHMVGLYDVTVTEKTKKVFKVPEDVKIQYQEPDLLYKEVRIKPVKIA